MDRPSKQHRFSSIKEALEFFQEKDGCHIFQGSTVAYPGYGIFSVDEKKYRAHRASYEFYIGKIPSDRIICHKCNVKLCINPAHLYAGTRKDNARDRMIMLREREKKGDIRINKECLNIAVELINELTKSESKKFTMIFPRILYDKLKMTCLITRKNMSEFIRLAIIKQIKDVQTQIPSNQSFTK